MWNGTPRDVATYYKQQNGDRNRIQQFLAVDWWRCLCYPNPSDETAWYTYCRNAELDLRNFLEPGLYHDPPAPGTFHYTGGVRAPPIALPNCPASVAMTTLQSFQPLPSLSSHAMTPVHLASVSSGLGPISSASVAPTSFAAFLTPPPPPPTISQAPSFQPPPALPPLPSGPPLPLLQPGHPLSFVSLPKREGLRIVWCSRDDIRASTPIYHSATLIAAQLRCVYHSTWMKFASLFVALQSTFRGGIWVYLFRRRERTFRVIHPLHWF